MFHFSQGREHSTAVRLCLAALTLGACATATPAADDSSAKKVSEALARNAATANASVDKLCALRAQLQTQPALADFKPGARDAAALLEPLIGYEKPLNEPPGKLQLPEELANHLKEYGADWLTKVTDADLEGRDFAWLAALKDSDRWTLLVAGRLKDTTPGDGYTDPVPLYSPLIPWAKLRFAKAKRSGDWLEASSQVRHLAQLTRSQGLLLSEMVALAIIRIDQHARVAAAAAGVDVTSWPTTTEEQIAVHRRVGFASMYFAYPGVAPETLRKAVECMPDPCPALFEGALASRSLASFAGSDSSALVRELASAKGCEMAVTSRIDQMKPVAPARVQEVLGEDLATVLAAYLDGTKK